MAKSRASFFAFLPVLLSMIRWVKKTKDEKRNQGYGSPIFTPQRKKLKGYEKPTGRKKNFHKFKQH